MVECYSPAIDLRDVERCGHRATAAAAELRQRGRPVDYVGALLVPGDEVVFHLFSARSPRTVREASVLAGVRFERVVESIPVGIDALAFASGCPEAKWRSRR